MTINKKLFVIPGIVLGLVILIAAIALKPSPDLQSNYDNARLVEVIPLVKESVAPIIKGFGRVEPMHTWRAIAEVNGKISYRHPLLESGRMLKKGTLVLEVDPLQYQLKSTQAQANLNSAKAGLAKLILEQKNLNINLDIEQQKLALVNQEYQRNFVLQQKKLISNSALENQKKALLAQKILVQTLTNALNLMPDDKKILESQISVNRTLFEDSLRQLENTRLSLPFDAYISAVNIEQAQAVSNGEHLFTADQIGTVEIKTALSVQDTFILRESLTHRTPAAESGSIEQLNLKAQVLLETGNKSYYWPAKLTRIDNSLDPEQATIDFYLQVTQNIKEPDLSLPLLSKGMFVSGIIEGVTSAQFMVPEKALHGTQIYIMDAQQKLQIKTVQVLFRNNQGVAISGELDEGERLILNDLIPAIPGMSLKINTPETAINEQVKEEIAL
jgi:hypothetical protein